MANVQIQKTVFTKEEFKKTIDTSFNTYVDPIEEEDNDTIEELFRLYDKLFYEIPIEGDNKSHRYILEETSKLINFDTNDEEIQPLLDEISTLREQLLIANAQVLLQQNAESIEDFRVSDNEEGLTIKEITQIRGITEEELQNEIDVFTED